jgi:hypothetical protein
MKNGSDTMYAYIPTEVRPSVNDISVVKKLTTIQIVETEQLT